MGEAFIKDIEDFLRKLTLRSELDILTQLIFKFNLNEKLQALANDNRLKTKISCSISYIDKRPKISFKHLTNDKSVEIGDALFIFTKRFIKEKTSTPLGNDFGKALFIQAKKQEKDELKPKNESERKQFHLYMYWPDFSLFLPRKLGRFDAKHIISFGVNNTKKATCNDCNPGYLLKLSEKSSPVFYQSSNLHSGIGVPNIIAQVVSNSIGRNCLSDDDFSQFVTDLYEDSSRNTFLRKSVFGDTPQIRTKGDSFQGLGERGFTTLYPQSEAQITFNKLKLLVSTVFKSFSSFIVKYEKRIWIIKLETTHYE